MCVTILLFTEKAFSEASFMRTLNLELHGTHQRPLNKSSSVPSWNCVVPRRFATSAQNRPADALASLSTFCSLHARVKKVLIATTIGSNHQEENATGYDVVSWFYFERTVPARHMQLRFAAGVTDIFGISTHVHAVHSRLVCAVDGSVVHKRKHKQNVEVATDRVCVMYKCSLEPPS